MLSTRPLYITSLCVFQQTGPKLSKFGPKYDPSFRFGPNARTFGSSGVKIVYGSLDYPFIVVDKQPGLGVQFRADRNADSLEKRLNDLGKKSCFFVNRLDAVTQGLMVVAFSVEAASLLGKSMDKQEWFKKYRVLSPIPNWLHKFYTDFSVTFPTYNGQPTKLQNNKKPKAKLPYKNNNINLIKLNTKENKLHNVDSQNNAPNDPRKLNKKENKRDNIHSQNTAPNKNPIKIVSKKENSREKALDFLKQYFPNKSPFISGDLLNNKMQLCKNGILISHFTRFSPTLRSLDTPLSPQSSKQRTIKNNLVFSPSHPKKEKGGVALPASPPHSPFPLAAKNARNPAPSHLPPPLPSSLPPDLPSLWDYATFSKGVIDDKLKPFLKKSARHHSVPRKFDDVTKLAITEFELVATNFERKYLIYEVILHTGRTHQIRSHFSESGFPIYNDILYSQNSILARNEDEEDGKSEGIGLQAFYLQFPDPYKRKFITIKLGMPAEFSQITL